MGSHTTIHRFAARRFRILTLAVAIAAPGCARDPRPRIALAGSCYTFIGWDTTEAKEWALPAVAKLSAKPWALDTTAFELIPESDSYERSRRFRYWRPLPPDSVEVVVSTGFSGVRLRLSVGADTLRGMAYEIYDAGDGATRPSVALHVPCGEKFQGR